MTPTTTTATAAPKKTQNVIAVSESAKHFVASLASAFIAPSKSKPEGMQASEREVFDAMVDFVEAFRFEQVQKTEFIEIDGVDTEVECFDTDGNPEYVKQDNFTPVMNDILALRMETVRTNSSTAKIDALTKEREELLAEIAKLRGDRGEVLG